ncbi:MAG: ankyrin repeat domain-containing protein [Candidatus Dependentiae bacterium]
MNLRKIFTQVTIFCAMLVIIGIVANGRNVKEIATKIIQDAEQQLIEGLMENDLTKVAQAVDCGASVDSSLEVEEGVTATPLIFAIANTQLPIAKYLITKEPNLEIKDTKNNWTPLLWAIFMAGLKKIAIDFPLLLIAAGSEVNPFNTPTSPLILAIAANRDGSMQPLIDTIIANGAEVNFQGSSTPLISAIKIGNKATVEKLIEFGADVNLADKRGITPLQMAEQFGNQEIIGLLKQKGAQ